MEVASNYTALEGLMQLLSRFNNYPALGTGSLHLSLQARSLLGGSRIPPAMQAYTSDHQINLFGDYPTHTDKVPCIIFAVVFGLLTVWHAAIFIINFSRGHRFWLSIGWFFYGIMRIIGWVLRMYWGKDLSQVQLGIAAEVFLIVPTVFLVSFNLILAQRIFTWRHPVGGSRRLFWNLMITLYAIVTGLVVMTIVASAGPYINLLSPTNYTRYKKAVEATSVFVLLYSLTSTSLLGLAFFFKPTTKDENLYTYQPWWIESFSPLYFVKKGAPQEAALTFMRRRGYHRRAIRVIAATHHHYNTVEGLTNQRGDLKHNISLFMIVITTLLIFVGAIGRAIAVFQGRYAKDSGPICKPVVMYVCWGAFEVIINLMYLIGRVDLRFYRPDKLPRNIREIISANQSGMRSAIHSDVEDEEEVYSGDKGLDFGDDGSFVSHDDDLDFTPPSYREKHKHNDILQQLLDREPRPKGDGESEFNF